MFTILNNPQQLFFTENDIKYNVFYHKNAGYEVQINLAGFNKEDIEVYIKNDRLVVKNREGAAGKPTDIVEVIKQFSFNHSFELTIPFNFEIESTPGAQNSYKNGVLTIYVRDKKEKETKVGFIQI